MPVKLPCPAPAITPPSPPRIVAWLGLLLALLLLAMLLGSILWNVFTWPKNDPGFWRHVLGAPFLGWCLLVGFRLYLHEVDVSRLTTREEARRREFDEAVAFGAEPLAVLGAVYLCAMQSGGASGRIVKRESVLRAHAPKPRLPPIRHSRLPLAEGAEPSRRHLEVFEALLSELGEPLRALPHSVPLDVKLHVPGDADPAHLLDAWKAGWANLGLRKVKTTLVPASEGLMRLDSWLDEHGGPTLEKFSLFVAIQLYVEPPENSAEAAVALLLGWAPLAERHGLPSIAMLHRPLAGETAEIASVIKTAALFGRAKPEELWHLWQSGLSKADKAALLKSGSDVALGAAQTDELAGVHDIDAALGHSGVAAPWLSTALAVENAGQSGEPQLIVCREDALRLAVVHPAAHRNEREMA